MMKKELNIGNGEMDKEKAIQLAEQLVSEIDGLKGLVMKFGQMSSYLNTGFPPEVKRILARLQAKGNCIEFDSIKQIIQGELGDSHHDLFEQFDDKPFAAASIGQVHRARYNQEEVAVKVQYPKIEEAIKSDLDLIGNLLFVPLAVTKLDRKGMMDEFGQMMLSECDYVRERESQEIFSRLFRDTPEVVIPRVIGERSSQRVLTTELIQGRDYYSLLDSGDQEAIDQYGVALAAFVGVSLYHYGIFNADPHPGNYIFLEDHKVAFLDFGSVKVFDQKTVELWKDMGKAILGNDRKAFKEITIIAGICTAKNKRFDWDYHWEYMAVQFRPYMSGSFQYTVEYVREVNEYVINNKNKFSAKFPPDWLFLMRFQFGFVSILADLKVTGNFREWLEQVWSEPFKGLGDESLSVGLLTEVGEPVGDPIP